MAEVRFDSAAVLAALQEAVVAAWAKLIALDPPEDVYGLMLYEGSEYGYVCASGFTSEGLDRTTAMYRQGEWGADYEGAAGREGLRWSTQDSPYHVLAEVGSPPLVSSEQLYADDSPWAGDDEADERYKSSIRMLCMQALRELDAAGTFGDRRSGLTLLIEDRDGSESIEEYRQIVVDLNPPEVVARYDEHRRTMLSGDTPR